MNTMWKSMRVDKRFDMLLDKKLYHLEKSRKYRARELVQGQEEFLEDLTKLFERQCEIAADKLEDEIGDSLLRNKQESKQARMRGSRRKSMRRMRSFTVPIHNVLSDSEVHVVPGCEHERPPPKQSTLGEDFRLASAKSFGGRESRENFLRSFSENEGRVSACCIKDNEKGVSGFETPSRMKIQESRPNSLLQSRRPPSIFSRPGTGTDITNMTSYNTAGGWNPTKRNAKSQPNSAKIGRCQKCEPTIAWEIVPRHKGKRRVPSGTLQSTVFQPGNRDKTPTDEETLFRKQFLACAMARFLPISALQGPSFGEHDDIRKKLEGRRRCLDELKNKTKVQIQADSPPPTRVFMYSGASRTGVTTRASSYPKSSMMTGRMSSMNTTTPGSTNILKS